MAPKKGGGSLKKAATGTSHDKEWVASIMGETAMNFLVEAGVLTDQATTEWRPATGEPFPMPNTNELVVFEDFFWPGFGLSAHPFLQDLIEYDGVSLCNLHPNTTCIFQSLSISANHILEFSPTSICFVTFSSLRRKGDLGPRLSKVCICNCGMEWPMNTSLFHSTPR